MTREREQVESTRWRARPIAAASVRGAVLLVPTAASVAAVWLATRIVPPPSGSLGLYLAWWLGLSALATLALVGVGRACRRLLPLAALLRLSLVFPDATPSRFRTAAASGTVRTLEERLAEAKRRDSTPADSARRLLALAAALDEHDGLTRGHSERVRAYSQLIGRELGLGQRELELLNWAALLHDVGKLEIPAEILNKRGRPTDEEWATIRSHPRLGDSLVAPLRAWLGDWADAVGDHHEHWNGGGYPRGLAGADISLAGRIVAVADVFDVITSTRSYKQASTMAAARAEIARCAGTQFDPDVVRAFLAVPLGRARTAAGPVSWLAQAAVLARTPLTSAGTLSAAAVVGVSASSGGLAERAPGFDRPAAPQRVSLLTGAAPQTVSAAFPAVPVVTKTPRPASATPVETTSRGNEQQPGKQPPVARARGVVNAPADTPTDGRTSRPAPPHVAPAPPDVEAPPEAAPSPPAAPDLPQTKPPDTVPPPTPPTGPAPSPLERQPDQPDAPSLLDPPKLPEAPALPETPDLLPDTPLLPETPTLPRTPPLPATPEVPDTPQLPETPRLPDVPSTPAAPQLPPAPSLPAPSLPEAPSLPSTPTLP